MKWHRNLVEGVGYALFEIFEKGRPADKVIKHLLKQNRHWGSRDRHFVAMFTYECVRYWRLLHYMIGKDKAAEGPNVLECVMALAVFKDLPLPEWPEAKSWPVKKWQQRLQKGLKFRAIRESIPDWLDELGLKQVPEWDEVLAVLNQPAQVVLRANTLRTDRQAVIERLAADEVTAHAVDDLPDALYLTERSNVFRLACFKEGWFEVQDANSQRVAHAVDPKPGETVIDACAGAGGKSLHLAALMQNKGKILALDIHEKKLLELDQRRARAGADIIEARPISSTKTIKRLKGRADRLLLDVPCSGLGVLRRNPDTKWRLLPERVNELIEIQRDLLIRYSTMLKPGGRLVYSTCSILPSENQDQVAWFVDQQKDLWTLVQDKTYYPHRDGYDGFYIAVLEKRS